MYPDSAVDVLRQIKELRADGLSMDDVANRTLIRQQAFTSPPSIHDHLLVMDVSATGVRVPQGIHGFTTHSRLPRKKRCGVSTRLPCSWLARTSPFGRRRR